VRDENGTVILEAMCQPGDVAPEFMYGAFEYVKLATYSVVPFVLILTLNVAIIAKLRRTAPLLRHSRHSTHVTVDAIPLSRVADIDPTVQGAECRRAGASIRRHPMRQV